MKHEIPNTPIDVNDIEARARAMRAEAMQEHAQNFGRWLKGTLGFPGRTA